MERYREIIEDYEEFTSRKGEEPLKTVRRNDLKARDDFEERLEEDFEFEQSSWNPRIYRLETDSPGKSMLHWRGEYYVQEESAALPVEALNPKPGEKVLDMCAAPGGKTTQIAARMENRGEVVANDESGRRLKSLHSNVYRTGSACVKVTNYDGRRIPEDRKFNRVLVDAPCSGEADHLRRGESAADKDEREGLAALQKHLLVKAASLVKDGGKVVYSTCTFAPEENEEVVSHALDETELELEDFETDAPHVDGVTEFQGVSYGSKMEKTVRMYPHHLDSGGIYVAVLTK